MTPNPSGEDPALGDSEPAAKRQKLSEPAGEQEEPANDLHVNGEGDKGEEWSGEDSEASGGGSIDDELAKLSPEEDRAQFEQWLAEQKEGNRTIQNIFEDAGFGLLVVRSLPEPFPPSTAKN